VRGRIFQVLLFEKGWSSKVCEEVFEMIFASQVEDSL